MIIYADNVPDVVVRVEAPRGVGYDDHLYAKTPHYSDGEGAEVLGVTLVGVETTAKADGLDAGEETEDELTLVTGYGGLGEGGDGGVGERLGVGHRFGQL